MRKNSLPIPSPTPGMLLPAALLASACGYQVVPLSRTAAWSLESAPFVLTAAVDGQAELFLARTRSDTAWVRLTESSGLDNSASWSPDGRRLVFHSTRDTGEGENLDLYLLEPGAKDPPTRLTDAPEFDYLPDFSPDGARIAFLSRRPEAEWPDGSPGHIYVMNADGTEVRRATRIPVAASLGPAWMPDGESLLVARRTEPDGPTVIARLWLDFQAPAGEPLEAREEILVEDALFNYTPAPAPDGRRIAYTAEGDTGAAVVILDLATGERRTVVGEGFHYVDEWTPDGRWIVATRWDPEALRRDAWLLSADRSEEDQPLLRPPNRAVGDVAFRPGRQGSAAARAGG